MDVSTVPQRIVALAPSSAEIVCSLGAGDRLVGVGRFVNYPPELAGLPRVGGLYDPDSLPRVGGLYDPDLEQILGLEPDLLITRGASAPLTRLCRDRNITLYEDPTDTLTDLFRAIEEIGARLGLAAQADALATRTRAELDSVKARVADRPPVDVLLTMRQLGPIRSIYTVGQGPYLNELLEIAGGRNLFKDIELHYPEVSGEQVLARGPAVIIELMPGEDYDESDRLLAIEQWRALGPMPATESGRVYLLTADFAQIPSPRITQMARLLADYLHPEVGGDE
ncbi:MAG: ABC transporter substrate-binding protein [Planctomycetes bacterium]|nr:ABC transporter substrate-binding protein [Planctomycetota bacterium]